MNRFALALTLLLLLGSTLQARAAALNVADFGARPDDAVDDTAAINRALAQAQPGDEVRLAQGVYVISGALTPKSGAKLLGAGREASVLCDGGGDDHVMIRLEKVENVEVADLALDGAGQQAVQQGILASGSKNLTLHRLAIRSLAKTSGWGPHGILFSKEATDSLIADNEITSIGLKSEWGGGVRLAHGSARNRVLNNVIAATGRGGVLAGVGCDHLVVRGNKISGSGGEGLGIEMWGGCPFALIEDNVIDHWLSIDDSSGSAIRRNVVSDKSGVFKHIGLELVSSSECVFTDNVVDGGADIGISISNKKPKNHIYWANNTVRGASTWGAQLQGDEGGAAYHYFYMNRFLDTPARHPHARYKDSGHGFRINGNARSITLEGCEITSNAGAALQFVGKNVDRLSFRNLTITNNGGPVINGKLPAELEWVGNVVKGNGRDDQPQTTGFAGPKPTAAFEAPATAKVGEAVKFKNLSNAPQGGVALSLWDFGAGLPSTEPNPAFTYETPGKRRVALLVWDGAGYGVRAEREIDVQP